jgi:hypothetical protein
MQAAGAMFAPLPDSEQICADDPQLTNDRRVAPSKSRERLMDFARCVPVFSSVLWLMFAQDEPTIAGVWRGQSSCTQKESACREETVVYRFSPHLDKPGSFSASADKIVDGKAVNMGTLEFQYIAQEQLLVCKYAQGAWRILVDGEKMEGTLTRPDGSSFRRLLLRKTR